MLPVAYTRASVVKQLLRNLNCYGLGKAVSWGVHISRLSKRFQRFPRSVKWSSRKVFMMPQRDVLSQLSSSSLSKTMQDFRTDVHVCSQANIQLFVKFKKAYWLSLKSFYSVVTAFERIFWHFRGIRRNHLSIWNDSRINSQFRFGGQQYEPDSFSDHVFHFFPSKSLIYWFNSLFLFHGIDYQKGRFGYHVDCNLSSERVDFVSFDIVDHGDSM